MFQLRKGLNNLLKNQRKNLYFQNKFYFAKIDFETKPSICYYKVLNVSSDARQGDIKKEYLKLAKKYHPDVNQGGEIEAEKFKEVQQAYQVLSNPDKRKIYDEQNGLNSFWQHSNVNKGFGENNETYEDFINRKRNYSDQEQDPKDFKTLEEEVDNYFKSKYFKNPEMNKKYPDGHENPFEMTAKLYRTHRDNIESKKQEYEEHFPGTYKSYYEKKETNQELRKQGNFIYQLKEFKIPIFALLAYLTVSGIYRGVKQSNENKEKRVQDVEIVTEGRGYRTKALPLNAV